MQVIRRLWAAALALGMLSAGTARAVNLTVNFDQFGAPALFNSATPNGITARKAVTEAAAFFSTILIDTLGKIDPPFYQSPSATITWTWTMGLNHPNSTSQASLVDQVIAADEYRIYVGARLHAGSTLAVASPGWVASWGRTTQGNPTSQDLMQRAAIDAAFQDVLDDRGEASGFASWGGSISFDSDTPWHLDHTTPPAAGKIDLYSVALHEIAHTLGFGVVDENNDTVWESMLSGSNFIGSASTASYGGPVPLNADRDHWANGVTSTVYGQATSQLALMSSGLTAATRRRLTTLDAAALTDLGWSVAPPPQVLGDYNRNGVVDAADYAVWRNTFGQTVAAGTGADGSGNGIIGIEDRTIWRSRFGRTSGSGSDGEFASVMMTVPEPAGVVLATGFGLLLGARRRRMCGQRMTNDEFQILNFE